MSTSSRILRNSLWMSIQPIMLNVISIFVIGFIADKLGQVDYGKFVYAFSLAYIFMPLCELGLRAVTVRDMAADKANSHILMGRLMTLRLVLSVITCVLLVVYVNIKQLHVPPSTRMVVYIAGSFMFFRAVANTYFDYFQAREDMKYIAYSSFISGAMLTLFSVLIIVFGFRLIGVSIVYAAGNLLLLILVVIIYRSKYPSYRLGADVKFWKESIKKGFPFFLIVLLVYLNLRVSVLLLSKMAGEASIGVYGAALTIIEKLSIVPDSIGTAIFPTLAFLYSVRNMDELGEMCSKFFSYLLILGLGFSVGLATLAPRVILLIFGEKFVESGIILTIFSLSLPFHFMLSLFGYALGAVHLQIRSVWAVAIGTAVNLVLCAVLIPRYQETGAAIGYFASLVISGSLNLYFFRQFLNFDLRPWSILKVVVANAVMGLAIYLLWNFNLVLAIIIPGGLYLGLIIVMGVVKKEDLVIIKDALRKDNEPIPPNEGTKEPQS